MHVVRSGRGDRAVVFVHGFACDHSDWDGQRRALECGYEVVSLDLPGHGATPGRRSDVGVAKFARAVVGLLREPAVLVGHSLGCRVILEASRLAPERIAGLVLVEGSRLATGDAAAAVDAARSRLGGERYRAFLDSFFADTLIDPLPQREAILARARVLEPELGEELLLDIVRWDATELDAALSAVRSPMLAIQSTTMADMARVSLRHGDTSPWLELLRTTVPNVQMHLLPGRGHFVHIEAAEEVSQVVDEFCRGLRQPL